MQEVNELNELTVKVTTIKGKHHARLFVDGKFFDEMSCELREDIGWICREMLRWYDKSGGNRFSHAARKRHNKPRVGNVWYIGSKNFVK